MADASKIDAFKQEFEAKCEECGGVISDSREIDFVSQNELTPKNAIPVVGNLCKVIDNTKKQLSDANSGVSKVLSD